MAEYLAAVSFCVLADIAGWVRMLDTDEAKQRRLRFPWGP
jgi:hypothetical protein